MNFDTIWKDFVKTIRPYYIHGEQDKAVKEYIEQYKYSNNGVKPNRKNVDTLIALLVRDGTISAKVDKELKSISDEIHKEIRQNRFKKLIIDSIMTILILCQCVYCIINGFNSIHLGNPIGVFHDYGILVDSIIVFFAVLIGYLKNLSNK